MSVPTHELSNLRLGGREMASRRQIAQQERRRREHEERQREEQALQHQQYQLIQPAPGPLPAPSFVPPPIQVPSGPIVGSSGIRYDSNSVPPYEREMVVRALENPQKFTVELAMRHEDSNGAYNAFQLKNSESVRIYNAQPTPQRPNPTCTCVEFLMKRGICSHIYWLYDGLNDKLFHESRNAVQNIGAPGIGTKLSDSFTQVSNGINHLPDVLNLRGEEAAESDTSDDVEIVTMLQDMVSVLDEKRLPDEFDDDFVADLPKFERSFSKLIVPGDPMASLFNLARHDPVLRDRLRNAFTSDVCSSDFLKKLELRGKRAFRIFDNYASRGPNVQHQFVSGCAGELRGIVSAISEYTGSRGTTAAFDGRAARLALELLDGVIKRDHDIYTSTDWLGDQAPPTAPQNRNLFANLIKSPIIDPGAISIDLFVLDLLSDLRQTEWDPLLESRRDLPSQLEAKGAPKVFVDRLRGLTDTEQETETLYPMDPARTLGREGRSDSSQRASSLMRRPEADDQRETQRRRME